MGRGRSGSGGSAAGRQVMRALGGGSSGVANAVYDEIANHMGRQHKRSYAEALAKDGATNATYFNLVMGYLARNAGVSDKMPDHKDGTPYRDVVKGAFGKRAFDAIDKGMREGAQRWLDENPTRRRRRRQSSGQMRLNV